MTSNPANAFKKIFLYRLRWTVGVLAVLVAALSIVSFAASQSSYFQRVKLERIAPGVRYYHFLEPMGPVNLDVLRINRSERIIGFDAILGDGTLHGVETIGNVCKQIDNNRKYPIGAINGDFYHLGSFPGMTLGVMVVNGEIVTSPPLKNDKAQRPCFAVYQTGQPDIAYIGYEGTLAVPGEAHYELPAVNRPRARGGFVLYTWRYGNDTPSDGGTDVILENIMGVEKGEPFKLLPGRKYRAEVSAIKSGGSPIPKSGAVLGYDGSSGAISRDFKPGAVISFKFDRVGGKADAQSIVGGWPILVDNGVNQYKPGYDERHPRTAIGFNKKEIYIAVVDGRRAGWSRGMSFHELGELMIKMKCTKAINFDGGGSSTMWVRGKVRNKVSDGKDRAVSNGIAVMLNAPRSSRLERISIEPAELSILTGYSVNMNAYGQDRYYNPVSTNDRFEWYADSTIGSITSSGVFSSGLRPTSGRIRARLEGMVETVDVSVYNEPPIFQIFPTSATFFEGETLQFEMVAMDHAGLPVLGDYHNRVRWNVTPGLGEIDSGGFFKAGNIAAKGQIEVSIGEITRIIQIKVGTVKKLYDDFERMSVWSFYSVPEDKLPGSFSITSRAAYKGDKGGELKYGFDNKSSTQAAYAKTRLIDLGRPIGIRIYVKGDGSDHELRLAYRNGKDKRITEAFEQNTLSNTQWHTATVKIDPEEVFPLKLESIYVLKNEEMQTKSSGTIYFDDVIGLYPPN